MNRVTQHLSRFDLVSIRLVVDCVQHGSLTAAAERAHLALPAASRRVKELEQAVGEPLFGRQGRRLQVTGAGRVFHRHAVSVLQAMEQMGGELMNLQLGVATQVRLSASTAAISQFLPPLLSRYARQASRVRIDLEEQVSDGVVKSLRDGRADVGVFVEGMETHGLECHAFRTDELVLVMPPGHRLVGTGAIQFSEALDEDWISFTEGSAVLLQQHQAAYTVGRAFRLRMQARSFDTVCHLVAAGMGIALLPKAAALPIARAMHLKLRPLQDPWAIRRVLVATRSGERDPGVLELVDFLIHSSQNAKVSRAKQK